MILIIDDDESVRLSLRMLLQRAGHEVTVAASPNEALTALDDTAPELVLQDMNFSRRTDGEEGLALLAEIRARRPQLPVILMTAWGSIALAVEGMRRGAADFITKPWTHEQILGAVGTALRLARAGGTSPRNVTRAELDTRYTFDALVGEDPRFVEILELIGRVANTGAPVLITGESGTGKEAIAEALHRNSDRRDGPFVKVNLGGMATSLFESEMFGHVRGAFTDASRERTGRFTAAHGGTIFLDEVGDLDPSCQVKLLRVLQDRTFEPLGSSRSVTVDVRVVSATNRPLREMVRTGRFREDLLYRLELIAVHLPPLRERRGDIPLLVRRFLMRVQETYGRPDLEISRRGLAWLARQAWPGNIRQLQQMVERTVLMSGSRVLEVGDFEHAASMHAPEEPSGEPRTLEAVERGMIEDALREHGGNISHAADALGLSRAALYRRLEKHGIRP